MEPLQSKDRTEERTHAVQFYYSDYIFADSVAQFVGDGLLAGQPVITITTQAHRKLFMDVLASQAFDLERAQASGQLMVLDAQHTLNLFMEGGTPHPDRFRKHIGAAIEQAKVGRKRVTVRAFGEMVDLLCRAGLADAALRLEKLWNDLAREYFFSLLCAYGMGNFYRETKGSQFQAVCQQHTHVIPPEDPDGMLESERHGRDTNFLRQRARVLAGEIKHCKELGASLRKKLVDEEEPHT